MLFNKKGMWISIKTALQIELCNSFDPNTGLIIYKSIITLVLVEICKNSVNIKINDELKLQMIKKLASRLNKLNQINNEYNINNNCLSHKNLNELIESISNKSKEVIKEIKNLLEINLNKSINDVDSVTIDLEKIRIYDHIYDSCLTHEVGYLVDQKLISNIKNKKMPIIERNLFTCTFPNIELICKSIIHLNDIEKWILYSKEFKKIENTSQLFELLDKYVDNAKLFYQNDPVGYSRMVLVAVKLICAIDCIVLNEERILKNYEIGFESNILEVLLLP
jgi:hypothetical protein